MLGPVPGAGDTLLSKTDIRNRLIKREDCRVLKHCENKIKAKQNKTENHPEQGDVTAVVFW